ncbi:Ferredoxin-thioredoxin reductase, variable chain [Morella rubra]|uniref:Ferredoxin-thioredoxin reductase, variable chain n=1 Tax=Morella rubra TaxID=262757 RepID=A0A6A1UP30_9ROSI|nr:Ferredoxin-thioredoxin reductase, variable chain [Morella rubra]
MTTPIPITAVSLSLLCPAAATPIPSSLSSPSLPSSVYAGSTGNVSAKQATMMMKSSIPSCSSRSRSTTSLAVSASCSLGNIVPYHLNIQRRRRRMTYCEVALESDSSTATTTSSEAKIGARVRVKVPLKVYHVPRVPEVDLTGMEGELKHFVGLWKGKSISANMPYKVEFVTEIQGRGPVKFFGHLKEDEFEYL